MSQEDMFAPPEVAAPVTETPPATEAPPVEAAPPTPVEPVQAVAPPVVADSATPALEYVEDDPTANVYTQLAAMQQRSAELEARLAEIQEAAARDAEARQDSDLTSQRDTLRQQMLAAIDSGDERARTMLGWQLQDLESKLLHRQQQRALASVGQKKGEAQKPTQAAPANVWEAFRAANRINDAEFKEMYAGLQKLRAVKPDVQETPSLYVHLLRQVRSPKKAATTTAGVMPRPAMVEGTGNTAPPKPVAQSKYQKSDLERMSELFGGKVSADYFAKVTEKE